jgi:hypothetical protein
MLKRGEAMGKVKLILIEVKYKTGKDYEEWEELGVPYMTLPESFLDTIDRMKKDISEKIIKLNKG